ncbi:hypothetical protein GCM10010399_08650 [Dactylosporangium fulvum]|uniref:Alpha/beta hydrolase n=1 Tax=Dactylosporangium fulvum TaxID=53359 RepID=A0ABY5W8X6_9ACTN|nr:hypothetical protein [Dactylosporangium fulvum]UWP86500.1 hypothetical protein Dfulv_20560 [Dactylosporangium fulvum]
MSGRCRVVLMTSPLLSDDVWSEARDYLALATGHEVVVPGYPPRPFTAPYTGRYCEAVAAHVDAAAVNILVCHSGAGRLAGAVVDIWPTGSAVVLVDARFPAPGRSWWDGCPSTLRQRLGPPQPGASAPAWADWWTAEQKSELFGAELSEERLERMSFPIPWDLLLEQVPASSGLEGVVGCYVQLSPAYTHEAARAAARGWTVSRVDSHHLGIVNDLGVVGAPLITALDGVRRVLG